MKFYPIVKCQKNAGSYTQKFYKGYEPRPSSKDIMAARRYIYMYQRISLDDWFVALFNRFVYTQLHVTDHH